MITLNSSLTSSLNWYLNAHVNSSSKLTSAMNCKLVITIDTQWPGVTIKKATPFEITGAMPMCGESTETLRNLKYQSVHHLEGQNLIVEDRE